MSAGIIWAWSTSLTPPAVRETHKLTGGFAPLEVVRTVYDRMETWSQLVLDALDDRTYAAPTESQG